MDTVETVGVTLQGQDGQTIQVGRVCVCVSLGLGGLLIILRDWSLIKGGGAGRIQDFGNRGVRVTVNY